MKRRFVLAAVSALLVVAMVASTMLNICIANSTSISDTGIDNKIMYYLDFDGDLDNGGSINATISKNGTVSYADGYVGKGAVLDNGYVSIDDFAPGKDSFTVAFWVKTTGEMNTTAGNADPCIISSSSWHSGINPGLTLAYRNDYNGIRCNIADGNAHDYIDAPFASGEGEGWTHIVAMIDRDNDQIHMVYNFTQKFSQKIQDALQSSSLTSSYPLNIGHDGSGTYTNKLTNLMVDEFMIYDGILSNDEVAELAGAYGMGNRIVAANVLLGESIAINYYAKLLSDKYDAKVKFTFDNKTYIAEAQDSGIVDHYKFAFKNIAPQCMGDNIKAELIVNGKVVDTLNKYSILQNVNNIKTENNAALVEALLHYGAAAQKYTNYKTDALVNAGLATPDYDTIVNEDRVVGEATVTGAGFSSAGVYHDNVNKIYAKVRITNADVSKLTVKVNGEAAELAKFADGIYIVYSKDIFVTDFDKVYTFELSDGTNTQTLKYSVNAYCAVKQDAENEKTAELAKAMYAYGVAAENYKSGDKVTMEVTTDIITSLTDIDTILERPYDGNVPTAFSEGIFTLHSYGWGFDNGTIFETGNADGVGMEIDVNINGVDIKNDSATWKPSHVTFLYTSPATDQNVKYNLVAGIEAVASYVCQYDPDGPTQLTDGIVSYTEEPRNRWANYISSIRKETETLDFDLGCLSTVSSVRVYPFDDGGATLIPAKVNVEYYSDGAWHPVSNEKCGTIQKNTSFDITFDSVKTQKIRLAVTPQSGKATGITEVEIFGLNQYYKPFPSGVKVEEKKFVTKDDIAASIITVTNNSEESIDITINATPSFGFNEANFGHRYVTFGGSRVKSGTGVSSMTLAAGESAVFKNALAFADKSNAGAELLDDFVFDSDVFNRHVEEFIEWFATNVPYFDCDDEEILQTYYFRWLTYRNHIRKITSDWNGYIISEFLPNVQWSGKYNSISCPASHHLYEGRWIRNGEYLDSYQEFWFTNGANPRLYSFPIADSYYNRYLVSGDKDELVKYLEMLDANYESWEDDKFVESLGLFQQLGDRDGMELGVGGDGVRPTINSYMYGDAVAIADIARMVGNTELANKYDKKAADLKAKIRKLLWNSTDDFFETITTSGVSVGVRELIGYVPWYYNIPEDSETYSKAFEQLLDNEGFLAPFGPTTVEQRDPGYQLLIGNRCRWDGPSWPFATSQTLVAAANLLNNYKQNNTFDKGNWYDMLRTYALSQYKDGYSWIGEDLRPDNGEWIIDYKRSVHYNHSTFADLVITGLVGIRPEDNDDTLTINPLFEADDMEYFTLENVSYRGHNITVTYDKSGEHYGIGKGMRVYIDGRLMAESASLGALAVSLNVG